MKLQRKGEQQILNQQRKSSEGPHLHNLKPGTTTGKLFMRRRNILMMTKGKSKTEKNLISGPKLSTIPDI